MNDKDLLKEIDSFKDCINKYIKVFMENYPTEGTKKETFAPQSLFELAIEAQTTLAIFGTHATKRFEYIGFFELFYFDNPVDWHAWKYKVIKEDVDFSSYASISFRIEAEIERMRVLLEKDSFDNYQNLTIENYLISKNKYFKKDLPATKSSDTQDNSMMQNVNINIVQNDQNEKKAFIDLFKEQKEKELDENNKKTSIISNIVNILSKMGLLA